MQLTHTYFNTALQKDLGVLSPSLASTGASTTGQTTSLLGNLSADNFAALGNIGSAASSIASLFQGINGFMSSRGQLKEMKRNNDLLEKQWHTENKRYNEEKKIRDEANAKINDSAKYFDMPMERD